MEYKIFSKKEEKMKKFTKLFLVGIMVFALVACGGGGAGGDVDVDTNDGNGDATASTVYTSDEVQMVMADLLGIDESEINVENRDTGIYVGYGDWDIWFDAYILNDPGFAPEMFEIGVWDDVDYEKRIDNSGHKIWIEYVEVYDAADPLKYTVMGMKGNFVISLTSTVEPDVVIDALDLD